MLLAKGNFIQPFLSTTCGMDDDSFSHLSDSGLGAHTTERMRGRLFATTRRIEAVGAGRVHTPFDEDIRRLERARLAGMHRVSDEVLTEHGGMYEPGRVCRRRAKRGDSAEWSGSPPLGVARVGTAKHAICTRPLVGACAFEARGQHPCIGPVPMNSHAPSGSWVVSASFYVNLVL
jgi:hypothetical protein